MTATTDGSRGLTTLEAVSAKDLRALITDKAAFASRFPGATIVSQSSRGRVYHVREGDDQLGLYIKVFEPRGLDRWRATFVSADPKIEYDALTFLRRLGIPTVEPLRCEVWRDFGMVSGGVLVTQEVLGAMRLDHFFAKTEGELFLRANREALVRTLRGIAEDVAKMHRAGFIDGDLHFRNILIRVSDPMEWFFLDHPRAKWRSVGSRLHSHGIVKDLACLDKHAPQFFSKPMRLRFFLAYCGRARLTLGDKSTIQQIEALRMSLLKKRERKLAGAAD
jgi:hypothetical protein